MWYFASSSDAAAVPGDLNQEYEYDEEYWGLLDDNENTNSTTGDNGSEKVQIQKSGVSATKQSLGTHILCLCFLYIYCICS